ncbi:Clr5 domain-containing protein [Thelonectria olida]|uniref:Clr5 domain-containing protein n=1 Tax=Thelonectria olida TaxID=1576542 RepID=A0A9P8VZM1_9HYPO|nr:Clr5 domain-containing protein [Thelonectria olida]
MAESGPTTPFPFRPQCLQDWEDRRSLLTRLWWEEDKTLPAVMDIMKRDHGFEATAKQYMRIFGQWNLKKNVQKDEMIFMAQVQQRRNQEGKATDFTIRDRPVPPENIHRFMHRTNMAETSPGSAGSTPADIQSSESRETAHYPARLNSLSKMTRK